MTGHGQKLNRKQESAIAALIAQPTIAAAALSVGLSEATLGRWLADPDFDHAYKIARRQVVAQAIVAVQSAATEAVSTLREIMTDEEAPTSSRVAAARVVLESAFRAVEIEDHGERLDRLEAMAAEKVEAAAMNGSGR